MKITIPSSVHQVTWRKDNVEITTGGNHVIKVEGERHTLLIKSAKPSDGGRYSVTAVNDVGKESSSATLIIKAGACRIHHMVSLF